MNLEEYVIAAFIVPHGYQIDLIPKKQYLKLSCDGVVQPTHSECRDYGISIDVQEFSKRLIDLIRNAEKNEKSNTGV